MTQGVFLNQGLAGTAVQGSRRRSPLRDFYKSPVPLTSREAIASISSGGNAYIFGFRVFSRVVQEPILRPAKESNRLVPSSIWPCTYKGVC